jgi:hypothetical protein
MKFGMVEVIGIKEYDVEVTFNGMTSLLNLIKIYRMFKSY